MTDWFRVKRDALVTAARAVAKNAHAPYSNFHVGAALIDDQGRIYPGCNVENATYGATVCAERNAIGRAVTDGASKLVGCVVYVSIDEPATPCGICRQVLAEFNADMPILSVSGSGRTLETTIDALLPHRFRGEEIDAPKVDQTPADGSALPPNSDDNPA